MSWWFPGLLPRLALWPIVEKDIYVHCHSEKGNYFSSFWGKRLMLWAIMIQEDNKSLRHRRWAFPGPQGAGSRGRLPWVGSAWTLQIHLASKGQSPQDLPHLNVLVRVALGRQTLDWWTVRLPDPSDGSHASECVLLLEFLFRDVERRKEKLELCWITVSLKFFWKDKPVNRVIWNTIWQSFIFDILEASCPTHFQLWLPNKCM